MADVDTAGDGIRVRLPRAEADVLRQVVAELRGVLEGTHDRDDAVVARLFPDAYERPDEADAYRELTADSLTVEKIAALDVVDEVLGPRGEVDSVLAPEAAESWLRAITDVRLAIGTRLEVDEHAMGSDIDPSDPRAPALSVIHWLGWITEQIVGALRALD